MTSEIRLFTRVTVPKSKSVVTNPDEPADPEGGRGFAEWAMLTLHALRIELGKSYCVAVDLLSEMHGVLDEIGLTRLPHYTVLRTWFARISTKTWRAFLDAGGPQQPHAVGRSHSFLDSRVPACQLIGQSSPFFPVILLRELPEDSTPPKNLLTQTWFVEVAGFHRCWNSISQILVFALGKQVVGDRNCRSPVTENLGS